MNKHLISNSKIRKFFVFVFWIALWQAASMMIQNTLVFVEPAAVIKALWNLLPDSVFWLSILHSFVKICLGFFLAFTVGIVLAALSFRIRLVRELLEPLLLLCKSVPVASFIILALILIGSENLSVLVSFIIVLPMIYTSALTGFEQADRKLLEMARVFQVSRFRTLRRIYLPSLSAQLYSGCKVAIGMSWKSGIAAEVIGVPAASIGERLYMAKIYLNTADLFAWTVVILLLSAGFEKLFLWVIRQVK